MKRKSLLFLLLMALLAPWAANAQSTLTVYDGTTESTNVPAYMGYFDDFTRSQFVIPADALGEMENGTISSVKFYTKSSNVPYPAQGKTPAPVDVYLKEVSYTSISAFEPKTNDAIVYQGTLTVVAEGDGGSMTIEFSTPYTYGGGNLLVAIENTDDEDYQFIYFYGQTVTGASGAGYNSSSLSSVTFNQRNFIPKTTFTYTAGAPSTCPRPKNLAASDVTANSAVLTWEAGGDETEWMVEYKTADATEWTLVPGTVNTPTYTMNGLTAATNYQARVQAACNEGKYVSTTFTTSCDVITTFPWNENFNSLTAGIPLCWDNSEGTTTTETYKWNYCSTGHDGAGLRFNSYSNSSGLTNFLKTPVMNFPANTTMQLSFWYKNPTGGDFSVFISTDGGATYTNALAEGLTGQTTWKEKEIILTNYVGTADVVIVFKGTSNWGSGDAYIYLDDVTVKEAPSCLAPTGLAANASTTSAELSWTANSGETAWTIYYKKTTDENYTEVPNATNPYTLSGLTAATNYQYYVVANCSADEASEASEVFTFTTDCAIIPALGYTENFDSYTAAAGVLPICWNKINTTTYSSYQGYPRIYNYSAQSTPNCLYFYSYAYYSGGTTTYDPQDQYAILPEMTGLAGKQVTLMAKGSNASSTFKIGTMSDPADASTFQLIAEQALTTSYNEYSFIVNQQGNYLAIMIDAATESRTSNGVYIDDISIDNVPTCIKPTSPLLNTPSSRTAHTATLKWTNGEEGQTAWQIAYSTSATFAPAANFTPGESEGLVDADANPYTINGLQASTTYYAYVRANCGDGDLSAWSRTKATFTTTAATAVPTGLAVDASTITSNSATATWTGVATNDLHESFELYLSTEATMPEELVAENLITGITANSYEFTGLAAETTYYVWVRDNCGSDGLSAWSSRATFTTASSCPTPDGLAATNVTNESATITWNTYGFTGFNLRYGTDGENWTIEENVNTPYTLNDLTASTTYQVQVQATCADAETWSTVLSFTTACDAITDLPWNENFDAYTGSTNTTAPTGYPNDELPMCWQFLNRSNTTSSYPQVFISSNSGYPVSGNCLFFKSSYNTPLYAVLPAFEEEIAGLQLTFTYRNEGTSTSNGTLIVGYMTDPADATTFTTVLTCERTTTLTEKEVLFTNAPVGSYIAFKYEGGSSNNYYLSIDNVKVDIIPTCTKPTDLVFVSATTTTATLSWTAGADETAWQISLNGDEENLIMADSNPFTIEDLTASTAYTAKVRAYCSEEDQSDWSNEVSFATNCETIVVTDSWSEDFEDGDMPVCWSQNGDGTWTVGTGDGNTSTPIGAHTGTYNAKITHVNNGNVTKLITPVLDITSLDNPTLNFWYINRKWVNDIDGFAVYYRTASDADWTLIEATEEAHETWTEATYTLPNPSATYQIAFEMTDGYGYGVGIDDVTVSTSASSTVTQTIELAAGWNWFSAYVEGDAVELLQAIENGLGDKGITIKDSDNSTDYYGEEYGWYGELDDLGIANERMYMINVSESCTVELQGTPANPANHTITINPGWNWIGFPSAEAVSVAVALAGFEAEEGDILKSNETSTDYYGEEFGWFGELETLEPGQGYQYKYNGTTPQTLTFRVSARKADDKK